MIRWCKPLKELRFWSWTGLGIDPAVQQLKCQFLRGTGRSQAPKRQQVVPVSAQFQHWNGHQIVIGRGSIVPKILPMLGHQVSHELLVHPEVNRFPSPYQYIIFLHLRPWHQVDLKLGHILYEHDRRYHVQSNCSSKSSPLIKKFNAGVHYNFTNDRDWLHQLWHLRPSLP
ncbi:hypothetical protein F511_39855 [Dorcoceras hygrometricum]|uniref:Uncharacterized protein n=1 Tax=Dorcoceras hygrometricum TaxID=472368 RepID=A0A2Z7AGJ9_9LAMI|nr:hypothetical protein F511_39855 [Dorcoceras hygrometricum]